MRVPAGAPLPDHFPILQASGFEHVRRSHGGASKKVFGTDDVCSRFSGTPLGLQLARSRICFRRLLWPISRSFQELVILSARPPGHYNAIARATISLVLDGTTAALISPTNSVCVLICHVLPQLTRLLLLLLFLFLFHILDAPYPNGFLSSLAQWVFAGWG